MGLFTSGISKPRRFNHVPIYYDAEEEAHEERQRRISESDKAMEGEYRPRLHRGSFHSDRRAAENKRKEMRRLALLLVVLVGVAIFLITNGSQLMSLYFD